MPKHHSIPLPPISEADEQKFHSKVKIGTADECWLWQGFRQRSGHGRMYLNKKTGHPREWTSIHVGRLAWFLATGQDPAPLCVLHRCDNPPCCNPAHLFLGTQADNVQDMIIKGRANKTGARNCPESTRRGAIKRAKFDREDVAIVKALRETGLSYPKIAKELGNIHKNTVRYIIVGKRKHY